MFNIHFVSVWVSNGLALPQLLIPFGIFGMFKVIEDSMFHFQYSWFEATLQCSCIALIGLSLRITVLQCTKKLYYICTCIKIFTQSLTCFSHLFHRKHMSTLLLFKWRPLFHDMYTEQSSKNFNFAWILLSLCLTKKLFFACNCSIVQHFF